MIHAYLASEGSARKWATAFNDESKSLAGWREGNAMHEDLDETDQLAI